MTYARPKICEEPAPAAHVLASIQAHAWCFCRHETRLRSSEVPDHDLSLVEKRQQLPLIYSSLMNLTNQKNRNDSATLEADENRIVQTSIILVIHLRLNKPIFKTYL